MDGSAHVAMKAVASCDSKSINFLEKSLIKNNFLFFEQQISCGDAQAALEPQIAEWDIPIIRDRNIVKANGEN